MREWATDHPSELANGADLQARVAGDSHRRRIVAVFERVSSDKQDIARQALQRERAKADYPGLEIKVIQDDGVSAFKFSIFERLGGKRLCDLVEAGKVEAIYTDAQDRLSRGDELEWVTFRALCESHGTRLMIDGRELRNDLGGRLEGYLKALLARQESIEKSHRVSSARAFRARQGQRGGGPRPYGYQQSGGTLTVVPHEAEVLRRMHAEVLDGTPLAEIARRLNREGVQTAQGKEWTQARIGQQLRNRLYVGKVAYRGEEFDGNHEPIFTEREWRAAQAVLAGKRRGYKKGRGRPTKGTHVFTDALLRCGSCGSPMVPRTTRNSQNRTYELYACHGKLSGSKPECTQRSVRRERIDPPVLAYFESVGLDVEATRRHVREENERTLGAAKAMLADAEHQAALAEERLARMRRAFQDGEIDAFEWKGHREELTPQRTSAKAKVERLHVRVEEIAAEAEATDAEEVALRYLAELRAVIAGCVSGAGTIPAIRAALLQLFDGFTLHSLAAPVAVEPPPLPDGWVRSRDYTNPALLVPGTGGYYIEPHPRVQAVLGPDPEIAFPELQRTPVSKPKAASEKSIASAR